MARCPICGETLKWEELIEQMLTLDNFEDLLGNREEFLETLAGFVFRCPRCGEDFWGRSLNKREASKVFELLNEFKGGIDYENGKVRLKLTNLLALDVMLEEWDRKVGRGR